jgi:hypothetical protein
MNSATIPLAAMATFVAVYWLTPAPAVVAEVVAEAEPVRIAGAPAAFVAEARIASAAPAKRASARAAPSRSARTRRAIALNESAAVPVRRARAAVYFPGCNAVRAAGLAPLYRGEPGYRPEMDGDDDGIACEPHRGRRGRW